MHTPDAAFEMEEFNSAFPSQEEAMKTSAIKKNVENNFVDDVREKFGSTPEKSNNLNRSGSF